MAERAQATSPDLRDARVRLAALADLLGDAEMREAAAKLPRFTYTDGMWHTQYPGQPAVVEVPLISSPPLP